MSISPLPVSLVSQEVHSNPSDRMTTYSAHDPIRLSRRRTSRHSDAQLSDVPNHEIETKEDTLEHQGEKARARRQQTAYRRGIISTAHLCDWIGEEYGELDKQCVIRFPVDVAALLKDRFCRNEPLGLIICPTDRYDYRGFDIKVEGADRKLWGILLELPCMMESYKTLNGDLFFKSTEISQLLLVYDEKTRPDIEGIRDKYHWEWMSGLSPATHRLRVRKFKNFDVFDRLEIREAELEVIELLNSSSRDSYELSTHTESEMVQAAEKFRKGESSHRVITTADDFEQMLQEDGYQSDASDALFGLEHAHGSMRKITFSTRGFGRRPPGRPPGRNTSSRGAEARSKAVEPDVAVSSGGGHGQGGAPTGGEVSTDIDVDAAREKERRRQEKRQRKLQKKERKRLKKEKKKLKKEKKKAKKEKMMGLLGSESQGSDQNLTVSVDEGENSTSGSKGAVAHSDEMEDNDSADSSSDSSEDLSICEEDTRTSEFQLENMLSMTATQELNIGDTEYGDI